MPEPRDVDRNRDVLRRFCHAESHGELDVLDEIFASDVILHSPFPGLRPGIEGLKQGITLLREAFPDFTVSDTDLVAEGDKVVARCAVSGTHQGTFLGAAASGRRFETQEVMIARIHDGRIVELWSLVVVLTQRQLLGWL